MANQKEILSAVRGALRNEPGVEVASARDGVDALAFLEGVEGGDWEIHVHVPYADDLTDRPAVAYGRADASGYYHPAPADAVPAAVAARGEALVDRLVEGGLALSALGDREAGLVEALRALVRARDLDDEDDLERAFAEARRLAAPYHPDIAEAPAAGPAPRR